MDDWIRFMDDHEIAQAVLYPTAGLAIGLIQDPEWALCIAQAYNDWLGDRYGRHPRLVGVALLPVQQPDLAAAELRRAVRQWDCKAGLLPAVTQIGRFYGDPFFNPIFAEAQALGIPLAVHGAPSQGLGLEGMGRFAQVHALEHPIAIIKQFTHMVCEGIFERYPELNVAFLEAGAGWLPYMMDRLDEEFERSYGKALPITQKPSQIIVRGQIWVSAEVEESTLPLTLGRIGARQILWPSDFPHERRYEQFAGDIPALLSRRDLSEQEKLGILGGNARSFYHLPV